jgi:hypothetical protein
VVCVPAQNERSASVRRLLPRFPFIYFRFHLWDLQRVSWMDYGHIVVNGEQNTIRQILCQ